MASNMGRAFGLANPLIGAAISPGHVAPAVTGFAMWWMCRPARGRRTRCVPAASAAAALR